MDRKIKMDRKKKSEKLVSHRTEKQFSKLLLHIPKDTALSFPEDMQNSCGFLENLIESGHS